MWGRHATTPVATAPAARPQTVAVACTGPAGEDDAAAPSWRRYALAGLTAGVVVVLGSIAGGRAFVSHLPGAWFFGSPGSPLGWLGDTASKTRALPALAVYGGLGVLATLWWRLLRHLWRHPGEPVRRVGGVIGAWAAPFVVAPPLFSRDLYSYAAQGEMVSQHINAYHYGTGVLGVTDFTRLAGPFWGTTPSPYGPTFLSLDGLTNWIAGPNVLLDIELLRLLAVAGVVLMAVSIASIARHLRVDPAAAVLLGAGSPLVLTALIGGGHNDALMAGLVLCGLALWQRVGPVPAIVLCALATGVKSTAVLAVVVVGWNWAARDAGIVRRAAGALASLAMAAAVLEAVSAASGIGWGWVLGVRGTMTVHTSLTPVDEIAGWVLSGSRLLGVPVARHPVYVAATVAGFAVAGVVGTWLIWRSPRGEPLRSLGLSFLVLVLCSSVLWPWYVTWGAAVLAPVATGRLRRALVWLVVAETLVGVDSGTSILSSFGRGGAITELLVACGVVAAVLFTAGAQDSVPRAAAVARRAAARVLPTSGSLLRLRRAPEVADRRAS